MDERLRTVADSEYNDEMLLSSLSLPEAKNALVKAQNEMVARQIEISHLLAEADRKQDERDQLMARITVLNQVIDSHEGSLT